MTGRLFTFLGGGEGGWRVTEMKAVAGEPIAKVKRLDVVAGAASGVTVRWALRGITSNERYVVREEKEALAAKQPPLGRPEATRAALILIRKSAAWWALPQDERRKIFEEQSGHTRIGLQYLPAVARRLHHCRDLGESEPFDFITWFEYAPADEAAFGRLLAELRATREWTYVEREVEFRLEKGI